MESVSNQLRPISWINRWRGELAEDVEKLFLALRYLASSFTVTADPVAGSQSASDRHDHALKLTDELLEAFHSY